MWNIFLDQVTEHPFITSIKLSAILTITSPIWYAIYAHISEVGNMYRISSDPEHYKNRNQIIYNNETGQACFLVSFIPFIGLGVPCFIAYRLFKIMQVRKHDIVIVYFLPVLLLLSLWWI